MLVLSIFNFNSYIPRSNFEPLSSIYIVNGTSIKKLEFQLYLTAEQRLHVFTNQLKVKILIKNCQGKHKELPLIIPAAGIQISLMTFKGSHYLYTFNYLMNLNDYGKTKSLERINWFNMTTKGMTSQLLEFKMIYFSNFK